MKILQLIQKSQLRGAEIFACQLTEELKKEGHTVDVAYLFEGGKTPLPFDINFIALGAIQRKRFWDIRAYKKLGRLIQENGYDLVQANAGDTLKYAVFSKVLMGWKTPLVFRNASKMSSFIKSFLQLRLNRFLLGRTQYVISVSENCRQDLLSFFPEGRQKSETITIGTYDFWDSMRAKNSSGKVTFINVASFVPEKNHIFLLAIFNSYQREFKNAELWLVGDGYLRETLEAEAKRMGIGNHVKFLGYREDVIELLKQSDVLILPSLIEGLPGVILEAFSCGTPVIASAVGGIPEAIESGVNGYCIQQFDKEEYLAAIEKILTDKEHATELRERAYSVFRKNFMMDEIGKKFLRTYQQILKNESL